MIDNWDYRVLQQEYAGDIIYSIHEVFYDANGSPIDYVKVPVIMIGSHEEELAQTFRLCWKPLRRMFLVLTMTFHQTKETISYEDLLGSI